MRGLRAEPEEAGEVNFFWAKVRALAMSFDMEGRICYLAKYICWVVRFYYAFLWGVAEAAFLFGEVPLMPEGLNRVIQPSVFQLVLKEMHGVKHD